MNFTNVDVYGIRLTSQGFGLAIVKKYQGNLNYEIC